MTKIDPVPRVLKFDNWPQAERTAWESLFVEGDLFDDVGPCAHWSEGSRRKRRQSYGQWLSFLMREVPDLLEQDPVARITEPTVRRYLAECQGRYKPKSTAGLLLDLMVIAKALAPKGDWSWLNTVVKRYQKLADRRSLPPALPISAGEIFHWSLTRLAEVEADETSHPLRKAVHFRQALMIGLLIARPVRRRALLAMQVGQHVVPTGQGFELRFGSEDMKDQKARRFSVPQELVEPMRAYLEVHRRILLAGKFSDAFWISQYGESLKPDGLSRELPKVIMRHLGLEFRTHAFRNIAATSIAEADPENVTIIRDLLGHSTMAMADKHYNRATGIKSCDELQGIVDSILAGKPKRRRSRRGK
ncbi:tyrosine-type recombinase/integrase [Aliiruegeria sabulilitoris]|uniref:tyrosine-type recombinase/integrase n=1 Tax=Aliiruegeria sabulilitoris TaxID=1510458 RepID=UPI00083224B5|nr:tyrosine-type recombinase/integrase [Aliiruegeria sabulilitoris]NDR55683.1 site-specific integrase [Pseudoruegeria sp. M32A2M]